ncbi:hypothetical protein C2S52_019961 [Perilla frutescens var. hirtella]|nr:hypothetical protein C2S52_019961 [Perilla frutescens var. hirtella]
MHLGANVGIRCHLEWLQQVTDLLSAANLSRLRESCFGHLLGVADIQFQGQVYHILLRNHLLVDNPNRLRFLIHDKVHEFGPAEFGLITGLKFSGDYDLPKSSGMYDVCFPNKRSLKFVDILAAFKQECEISGGDSELSLKLAFLFLLYGVVLMKDKSDTNIQMQFVHLADDIEKFNDYPWGRVSYEYLVKATLSRKEVLEKQLRQGKKAAYDAFGFLMAFQVWAYEVIPDLASHCAHKIEGKEQVFPRILRWTAPEFFQYDYLMPFFLAEPVQPRGLLPPTEEELRHLQRLGLQQIHVSPPKLYPEVTLTEIGSSVKELLVRVGCIEMVMRSCKCLVNVDAVAGAKPGPSVHLSDLQSPLPPRKDSDLPKDVDISPSECEADGSQKEEGDLVEASLWKGSSSVPPKSLKSSIRKLFTHNAVLYDPLHISFMPCDAQRFEDWHDNARKNGMPCETPLPITSLPRVNWEWFNPLMRPRGWLGSEHIDALTNLLLLKYKQNKQRFLSGWTLMEQLGMGLLMRDDPQNVSGTLMDYVLGKLPREAGLPWAEARHVIGTANVNGNHWSAGLCAGKQMKEALKPVWEVFQFRHPPQQLNNNDCGLMTIKFMECLVSGCALSDVDPVRCRTFRLSYCAQLFELGLRLQGS